MEGKSSLAIAASFWFITKYYTSFVAHAIHGYRDVQAILGHKKAGEDPGFAFQSIGAYRKANRAQMIAASAMLQ